MSETLKEICVTMHKQTRQGVSLIFEGSLSIDKARVCFRAPNTSSCHAIRTF